MVVELVLEVWAETIGVVHERFGWKASLPLVLGPVLLIALVLWALLH